MIRICLLILLYVVCGSANAALSPETMNGTDISGAYVIPPSGVATTLRSVQLDYPAVCGVDNTTGIQNALNALGGGNGGTLVLPACSQTSPIIVTSLTIPNNTALIGRGVNTTWLQQAASANTPMIRGSNFNGGANITLNSNIDFGNMSIDGNGSNQSSAGTNRCVFFQGVSNLYVYNLEVLNCRSDAVRLDGNGAAPAGKSIAENIYVSGTVGVSGNAAFAIGFQVGNKYRNVFVDNVYVENTFSIGILIDASEGNWSRIQSKFAGTGSAATCPNSGATAANSPGGAGAGQTGWVPCGAGVWFRNVTNVTATNIVATQGQYHGVVLTGVRHSTISDVVATNNSLSSVGSYDDIHLDYNVFVAGGYGENSNFSIVGAQVGANGQMNGNPLDPSIPTSRYGLYIADGQTGAIADVISIANGGSSYAFNNSLSISGGTCSTPPKLLVTGAPGGVISTIQHDYSVGAGACSVLPSNPVSVTGGAGTGATFNVTWSNAYITGVNVGTTVTGGVRTPSFITGSGWTIQTTAGNSGP